MEGKAVFLESGGDSYSFIPCLNDSPSHIDMLVHLVELHTRGWIV